MIESGDVTLERHRDGLARTLQPEAGQVPAAISTNSYFGVGYLRASRSSSNRLIWRTLS